MCRCYSLFQITALVEEQSISFFPANCGDPTVPTNGSIGEYQNTTEGTVIMFGCDPGFVPAGNTTAVCASDGRWIPDPATLVCTCKSTHSHLQHKKLWVGGVVSRLQYIYILVEYIICLNRSLTMCLFCFRTFGSNHN